MFGRLKAFLLRFAKVPAEPLAPAGSPGSVRTFRAGENYWKYLLVTWAVKQAFAAFFIVVFASMTATWLAAAGAVRDKAAAAAAAPKTDAPKVEAPKEEPAKEEPPKRQRRSGRKRWTAQQMYYLANTVHIIELIGIGTFLLQLPFSLAKSRLNYEMRWYIVTDRSLRIREGVFSVREMTLTFANVQNISTRQGPLQRLLGLADVVVQTAGGGGSSEDHGEGGSSGGSMHVGRLRAVSDAAAVRDLILERLRRFRDAGLGDPDDRHAGPAVPHDDRSTLEAAAALRDAAKALAAALR